MGDFKSVRVDFGMSADLDRNEDEAAASAELRTKVISNLVAMGADAHPDRIKPMIEGNQPQQALPAPEPKKETAKRGPKPKVVTSQPTEPWPPTATEELLSDSIPETGGGTSTEADDLLDDGSDDLLAEEEIEVTQQVLQAKLREVLKDPKKGKAAMIELLRKVGATDLKTVPTNRYQELYAAAVKALAT